MARSTTINIATIGGTGTEIETAAGTGTAGMAEDADTAAVVVIDQEVRRTHVGMTGSRLKR